MNAALVSIQLFFQKHLNNSLVLILNKKGKKMAQTNKGDEEKINWTQVGRMWLLTLLFANQNNDLGELFSLLGRSVCRFYIYIYLHLCI